MIHLCVCVCCARAMRTDDHGGFFCSGNDPTRPMGRSTFVISDITRRSWVHPKRAYTIASLFNVFRFAIFMNERIPAAWELHAARSSGRDPWEKPLASHSSTFSAPRTWDTYVRTMNSPAFAFETRLTCVIFRTDVVHIIHNMTLQQQMHIVGWKLKKKTTTSSTLLMT